MRISSKSILAIFMAILTAVVVLLNQRQYIAILFFIPTILLAFYLLVPAPNRHVGSFFSAPSICGYIVLLAFISNLSYLTPEIATPFSHWLRLLYPLALLPIATRIFQTNPEGMRWILGIFIALLLVSIYKTFDASRMIEFNLGIKRQSNWGNAVGAASPFVFLVRRNILKNILLFATVVTLIVSLKRTGMLAAAALVIAYLVPVFSSAQVRRLLSLRLWLSFIGATFVFCCGTIYALTNQTFLDYLTRAQIRIFGLGELSDSGRLDIWSGGIKIFKEGNPFQMLFGRGYCWFADNATQYRYGVDSLHNDAIEFLVSFGVFGLILYLSLFGRIISHGLFFRKSREDASFAVSVTLIFLIYSTFAGVFYYIFFFAPLIVGIGYLEARRSILKYNNAHLMGGQRHLF